MKFALLIIASIVLSACSPYTRYGAEAHRSKPVVQKGSPTTPFNDYLRLGLIIRDKLGIPYAGSSSHRRGTDC